MLDLIESIQILNSTCQLICDSLGSVCIDENVEMMVENGVIPALVRYLESPWSLAINPNVPKSCDHKLEKDCAVSLGLIAAIQVNQSFNCG